MDSSLRTTFLLSSWIFGILGQPNLNFHNLKTIKSKLTILLQFSMILVVLSIWLYSAIKYLTLFYGYFWFYIHWDISAIKIAVTLLFEMSFVAGNVLKGIFSVLMGICTWKLQVEIRENLQKIDEFAKMCLKIKHNYKKLMRNSLGYPVLYFIFIFYERLEYAFKYGMYPFCFIEDTLNYVELILMLKYIFYVNILKFYLQEIGNFVRTLDDSLSVEVQMLQKIYNSSWETFLIIQKCFDWSLIFCFVNSILNFIFMYNGYTREEKYMNTALKNMIVYNVLPIISLLFYIIMTCEKCSKEVRSVISS